MDVPEIDFRSAVGTTTWVPSNPVKKEAIYFETLPSYEDFFHTIFIKNQLCIIGSSATASWLSRKHWVSENGSPNLKFLLENFGNATVPVADCGAEEFQAHPKTGMVVADFISYWKERQRQGHPTRGKCLYLKDWHFTRDFPAWVAYTPPAILCSDWLNEFWDVREDEDKGDDYRFVYMGPKHSWTPFHADVLRSYSWSANICGRKKWIFYRPGDEEKLRDQYEQLVFDLKELAVNDSSRYPQAYEAKEDSITLIQNPGEIIFVPSGWHHQVFNEEDTISINHNWVNGCNVHLSWAYIKSRLAAVEMEISDCKSMEGWESQCQLILKADSGISYLGFFHFISTIARHRLQCLEIFFSQEKYLRKHVEKSAMFPDPAESSCQEVKVEVNVTYAGNDVRGRSPVMGELSPETTRSSFQGSCPQAVLCLWHMTLFHQNANAALSSRIHESCPHWAHCGPNLALFDLRQVYVIMKDMEMQSQFKSVCVESGGSELDDLVSLKTGINHMLQRAKYLL